MKQSAMLSKKPYGRRCSRRNSRCSRWGSRSSRSCCPGKQKWRWTSRWCSYSSQITSRKSSQKGSSRRCLECHSFRPLNFLITAKILRGLGWIDRKLWIFLQPAVFYQQFIHESLSSKSPALIIFSLGGIVDSWIYEKFAHCRSFKGPAAPLAVLVLVVADNRSSRHHRPTWLN
jgi:hypothetical protein